MKAVIPDNVFIKMMKRFISGTKLGTDFRTHLFGDLLIHEWDFTKKTFNESMWETESALEEEIRRYRRYVYENTEYLKLTQVKGKYIEPKADAFGRYQVSNRKDSTSLGYINHETKVEVEKLPTRSTK